MSVEGPNMIKIQSHYNIGDRLRSLREMFDVSQGKLSRRSGIGESLISRYERSEVSPSWNQIERMLTALDQTPCALFADLCLGNKSDDTFTVRYYERPPVKPEDFKASGESMEIANHSPMRSLLKMVPEDDRYLIAIASGDWMIPDWYPGDLIIIDRSIEPAPRRILMGYYQGHPIIRRMIIEKKRKFLVANNRTYPPLAYTTKDWKHVGVVIHAVRDLDRPYVAESVAATEEE